MTPSDSIPLVYALLLRIGLGRLPGTDTLTCQGGFSKERREADRPLWAQIQGYGESRRQLSRHLQLREGSAASPTSPGASSAVRSVRSGCGPFAYLVSRLAPVRRLTTACSVISPRAPILVVSGSHPGGSSNISRTK